MKRYNIHLDPEWMKALDEIRQAVVDEKKDSWAIRDTTRSDLIRVAIGHYFGLGKGYTHYYGLEFEKIIKKVVKKRSSAKGV